MKTEAAIKAVTALKEKATTNPDEARTELSALYVKALKAIADGKTTDPVGLAKEVLKGTKIKFPTSAPAESAPAE